MIVEQLQQASTTDPEELALQKELERQAAAEDEADARADLADKESRRRTWQRLKRYGIYEEIGGDLESVYRALGRRSMGLRELARYMRHPDLFLQMQNEAIKRDRDAERAVQALRTRRREASDDAP